MGLIADAKAATDITEVLGRHVQLRKEGQHLLGRCPFHDDRGRPNLVVYPKTQTFKCFACGAYGDAVDFIAKLYGLSLGEAAKRLADEGKLPRAKTSRPRIPRPKKNRQEKAPPERLDAVYQALLHYLTLDGRDHEALRRRGCSSEQIDQGLYRTLGKSGRRAVAELIRMDLGLGALSGVPGFFAGRGGWTLHGPPGLLIPVMDLHHRVCGLQVRTAHDARGKYLWISTPGMSGGASSGAPCHVAGFEGEAHTRVWVTEGPLKADVAAWRMGKTFVAVAGVSAWRCSVPVLLAMKPSEVVIAFDQDEGPKAKAAVGRQQAEFADALRQEGLSVAFARWEGDEKGIDDALLARRCIHVGREG